MRSHEATVGPGSSFFSAVALVGVSFPIQTDICHQLSVSVQNGTGTWFGSSSSHLGDGHLAQW